MFEHQITREPEIAELGLDQYADELERDGLTVVPPDVNGFGVDRMGVGCSGTGVKRARNRFRKLRTIRPVGSSFTP